MSKLKSNFKNGVFFFVFSFLFASLSWAQITPTRRIWDLDLPIKVKLAKVLTTRVIAADYGLIIRDFPFLSSLSKQEIDRWLIQNSGFIAASQAAAKDTNTPIQFSPFDEKSTPIDSLPGVRAGFRPAGYGRALVFQVLDREGQPVGLIDAKGVGADAPKNISHSNGLMSLSEALREFIFEKVVNRVFAFEKAPFTTVGVYAVMDYGFAVTEKTESGVDFQRAGFVLRQAHVRTMPLMARGKRNYVRENGVKKRVSMDYHFYGVADDESGLQVEKILRKHGLTSVGTRADMPPEVDMMNVQMTKDRKGVFDFGAMMAAKHFFRPLYSMFDAFYVESLSEITNAPLLSPESADFVQPDPSRSVPFEVIGQTVSGVENPRYDNVSIYTRRLAESVALDQPIPREWVDNQLRDLVGGALRNIIKRPIDRVFDFWGNSLRPSCARWFPGRQNSSRDK